MTTPDESLLPTDIHLPKRSLTADKFSCGRVLVVGGSIGMAGAPSLSASAALRSGAGLVELHVPTPIVAITAGFNPCVMVWGGDATDEGTFAASAVKMVLDRGHRADCLAVGPGLGRSPSAVTMAHRLWTEFPQVAVFDADALWALAHLDHRALRNHEGPRILTPHAGEMLRFLTGGGDAAGPRHHHTAARESLEVEAVAMAASIDAIVVLKGAGTLITDGESTFHNPTGNPGMATAGSGDVLTGVIAALAAGGMKPLAAARLATWVHGMAGDIAAGRRGHTSMIATDVIAALSDSFLMLERAGGGAAATRPPV